MIRRDVLISAGLFRTDFSIYEDFDLLTRVALEGEFVVNACPGVTVRRVPSTAEALSTQHLSARGCSLNNLCQIYSNLLDRNLTREERQEIRRRLSGTRYELSAVSATSRQDQNALKLRWQSVRDDPCLRSLSRAILSQIGGGKLWEQMAQARSKHHRFRRSELDVAKSGTPEIDP